MRSVLPSPGDWATKSAPIWPLAPGLFSTMTCSFQISESFGAMRRARASAPPPGGKGTTMRTWQKALPDRRRERTRTKSFMGRFGCAGWRCLPCCDSNYYAARAPKPALGPVETLRPISGKGIKVKNLFRHQGGEPRGVLKILQADHGVAQLEDAL